MRSFLVEFPPKVVLAPLQVTATESVINVGVLEASGSFSSIWAPLAADLGVPLELTRDFDRWAALGTSIRIAAVGGVEDQFVATLAGLPHQAGLVVVGAETNHRLAIELIRAGAEDYFPLPGDLEILRSWLVARIDRLRQAETQRTFALREEGKYRFEGMLGTSPAHQRCLVMASRVIPRPGVTVLITGETGTGKELLARAIHYNGPRREAPFVEVNCAAIPEQLLESELFGHEKGSFTGATSAKPGLFEVANHGTIFLDEIGQLPLLLQGKLLRALEQRVIRRVGGTTTVAVDVRVVAATHVQLLEAVRRGEFREDLYYRLNVMQIELPPLRARGDDVVLLAHHFLDHFAAEYQLPRPALSAVAEDRLRAHAWDGNIRELRNLLERSLLLHGGGPLEVDDLVFKPSGGGSPITGSEIPFPATLGEVNRSAVRAMLERCRGNKSEAARRLAISRTRLARLLDGSAIEDLGEDA